MTETEPLTEIEPLNEAAPDDLNQVEWQALLRAKGWQNQMRLITQWGKLVKQKPALRQEDTLIQGCESRTWLDHRQDEQGRSLFIFDSESRLMCGLMAALFVQINGQNRDAIDSLDLAAFLKDAGLHKRLTPSRSNGLLAILQRASSLMNVELLSEHGNKKP